MFSIIKDGNKLQAYNRETLGLYATVAERLHVGAISAIWFACKHGQTGPLNTLYEGLSSNDQAALKFYIRRASAIVGLKGASPDGLPAETINSAVENGKVFGFKDKQFTIVNGHTSEQAKALLKLCETRFINPDGKNDKRVFERNNFDEVRTLGDLDYLKAVIKAMKITDTERRSYHLSPKVRDRIEHMRGQLEAMVAQMNVTGTGKGEPSTVSTAPAKAKAPAKARSAPRKPRSAPTELQAAA